DLLSPDPFGPRRLEARPAAAAVALHLAALDRQGDGIAAFVARRDLESGGERMIDEGRIGRLGACGSGWDEHDFGGLGDVEWRHASRVPYHDHGCRLRQAADPGELFRFEPDAALADRLIEGDRAVEGRDHGAIAWRRAIEIVDGADARRAGHALDHEL